MKPLLAVLRENNRYVFIESKKEDFRKELNIKFKDLFGIISYSLAGLRIITWNNKKNQGIIKVNRKYLKHFIGTLTYLNSRAIYVSGTIKKLNTKIRKDRIKNTSKTKNRK